MRRRRVGPVPPPPLPPLAVPEVSGGGGGGGQVLQPLLGVGGAVVAQRHELVDADGE
ncbi:hypothetical protein LX36DRAFT_714361, partial [Colletotrichum falcatum]